MKTKLIVLTIAVLALGTLKSFAQTTTADVDIIIDIPENYMNAVNLYYGPILMTIPALNTIESVCDTKNWIFVPDSGGSLNY